MTERKRKRNLRPVREVTAPTLQFRTIHGYKPCNHGWFETAGSVRSLPAPGEDCFCASALSSRPPRCRASAERLARVVVLGLLVGLLGQESLELRAELIATGQIFVASQ